MTTESETPKPDPSMAPAPKDRTAGATGRSSPLSGGQTDLLAGVTNAATRIVSQAASVLEEELNAGIGATQRLEEKLVDTQKLRSADPQEVMQRFRRDAHDVVDILIDLVNVATNGLGNLTRRMVTIQMGQGSGKQDTTTSGGIPALTVPTPISPGGDIEIPMTLENESNRQTETFNLLSSDLVNAEGERIPAHHITFVPESMLLEPHTSAIATVSVRVPQHAKPGLYSGLLQASGLEHLRAVLTIQIK